MEQENSDKDGDTQWPIQGELTEKDLQNNVIIFEQDQFYNNFIVKLKGVGKKIDVKKLSVTVKDYRYGRCYDMEVSSLPEGGYQLEGARDLLNRKQFAPDVPLKAEDKLCFRYNQENDMLEFIAINQSEELNEGNSL